MKVIKPGRLVKTTYTFTCTKCECVLELEDTDFRLGDLDFDGIRARLFNCPFCRKYYNLTFPNDRKCFVENEVNIPLSAYYKKTDEPHHSETE